MRDNYNGSADRPGDYVQMVLLQIGIKKQAMQQATIFLNIY